MRSPVVPFAIASSAALVLAGCAGAGNDDEAAAAPDDGGTAERLQVVATTTQLQDFVRIVAGNRVEMTGVMQRGVDAHDYSPSPADVIAIGEASVLVENGLGLEEWLSDTIESSDFDGTRIDASEGVEVREDDGPGPGHGHGHGHDDDDDDHPDGDPHIWQSPVNAMVMVENIADGLAAADPDSAEVYAANAEAYVAELEELDAEVAEQLADLEDRRFVSQHDAFGYYLDRYDLEFVGAVIPSFDSSAELSGAEINALVEQIEETGARAVFSEVALPPQTAETVAAEAGVTVVAGEDSLYADSLGPEGSEAETYLGTIRHNTRVIADALGG
jgi:ABC-type Zn uptake system ZnuABC Zn-binding protein ZnuA